MRNIVGINEVSDYIDESYIENLDLRFKFMKSNDGFFKGLINLVPFFKKARDGDSIEADFVLLAQNKDKLIDFLMSNNQPYLHEDNFYYDSNILRMSTIDFRVIIDDNVGSVSEKELMHVATVAYLMVMDIIDFIIGYDYIVKFMKKHGYTHFEHTLNNFIHISIQDESMPPFKGYTRLNTVKQL